MLRMLLTVFGFVLALWTAATALTQVQPGERAVVRRFGRILPDKPGPGLHIGWPWGIDQVERIAVGKTRRVSIGFTSNEEDDPNTAPLGQMLTGDHNLVNVAADIQYTVVDAEVEKYFLYGDRADALVARVGEAVLAEWIAAHDVDFVRLLGMQILPGELVTQVQERLRPFELGVEIRGASITRLSPPDEVKAAFDQVAQAESGRQTQMNAAHAIKQEKLRGAESAIFRTTSQTAAYATSQTLQAKSEAANFQLRLEQYRRLSQGDASYLNSLWLDEMTRLFARMQQAGRIDLLDHYLTGEGLSIVQFPSLPKRK